MDPTTWTPELISHLLSTAGVGGLLAGVMLFLMRRDAQSNAERMTELLARQDASMAVMIAVLKDNAAAQTKLATVIEGLQRQMERT